MAIRTNRRASVRLAVLAGAGATFACFQVFASPHSPTPAGPGKAALEVHKDAKATCSDASHAVPLSACFAEGTPEWVMATVNKAIERHWQEQREKGDAGIEYFNGSRWSGTQGSPRQLTWSFVPDGLSISSGVGEGVAPSNLFATLDSQYSDNGGRAVWIAQFQSCFDRWAALTGLSYTRITSGGNDWDDGASWGSSGSTGRGDCRISGKRIDGSGGILAYNFFPSNGDMVIDTGDRWDSTTNSFRFFRNVITHEHGHGQGIQHVCPANSTKLMEPFVSTSYDTIRHDDIRASQRHYGDAYEDNDNTGSATPLGTLVSGVPLNLGDVPPPSIPFGSVLSIDGSADVDYYSFQTTSPRLLTATVRPVGTQYLNAAQSSNGSCPSGTTFDSLAVADLTFSILNSAGGTIVTVNDTGLGSNETRGGISLPVADTYYLVVSRANSPSQSQLYNFTLDSVDSGGGTAVQPSAYTFTRGVEQGTNDIAKLLNDDNVFATAQTRPSVSPTVPNVQMAAAGTTTPGALTELKVIVRSFCTAAPFAVQTIEAFNFSTNQYDVLPPGEFVPNTSETLYEVTITSGASNYLSGSGDLQMRVNWFDRGALTPAWVAGADLVGWVVTR